MTVFEIKREGMDLSVFFEVLQGKLSQDLADILLEIGQFGAGEMRRQIMRLLAKDPTGALARSVKAELITQTGDIVGVVVFPDKPYAEIQDSLTPTTIFPKKKFLAVPIKGTPVRSGASRGKWPRNFPDDTFKFVPKENTKSKKYPLLVHVASGRAYYTLRKSVTITGVGYVDATAVAAEDGIVEIMGDGLGRFLDESASEAGA